MLRAGTPAGTLQFSGEKKVEKVDFTLFEYDSTSITEKHFDHFKADLIKKKSNKIQWLNIDGLHQIEVIEQVGKLFNIHPLVLEDILNTDQRPKIENYGNFLYLVVKMLTFDDSESTVQSEQVSFVLVEGVVITFQEIPGDVFDPIRERLRNDKGIIRKQGADYLLYSLFDVIIDQYFSILEKLDEKVEEIDLSMTDHHNEAFLRQIHKIKRELIFMRKSIWPLREIISACRNQEMEFIQDTTKIYFKDIYDHCIQIIDTLELIKELLSETMELFLTKLSNRTNETMKLLTVISTTFMPLSFIAGLYGMNFLYMPGLQWEYGFPVLCGVMTTVVAFMLSYFKRKKWF